MNLPSSALVTLGIVLSACAHNGQLPARTVPGGLYVVGCDDPTVCSDNATRTVRLETFAIHETRVSVAAFSSCVHSGKCPTAPLASEGRSAAVVPVSHARSYCNAMGGHLPTADQWEVAARGTDGRKFPWGDVWDESRVNGWSLKGINKSDHMGEIVFPLGNTSSASPFGVIDMAGAPGEYIDSLHGAVQTRGAPSNGLPDVHGPNEYAVYATHRPATNAAFRCVFTVAP